MSKTDDDIPLFPVAAWSIGPIQAYGVIAMRLDFITNAMQAVNQPNPGRHYALTPPQARQLAQKLTELADQLESGAQQKPPGPVN